MTRHVKYFSDGTWPPEIVNQMVTFEDAKVMFHSVVWDGLLGRSKKQLWECRKIINEVRQKTRLEIQVGTFEPTVPVACVAAIVGKRWFRRNVKANFKTGELAYEPH